MSGYAMFKKTMIRIIWETRSYRKLYAEWYMYSGFFFAPAKQRNKSDLENLDKNVDIYIV